MANNTQTKTANLPEPPASLTPPPSPQWVKEAGDYLSSRGWKRVSVDATGDAVWESPPPKHTREYVEVTLPAPGGGITTIRQATDPPLPILCRTGQAMLIQRDTDRATEPVKDK